MVLLFLLNIDAAARYSKNCGDLYIFTINISFFTNFRLVTFLPQQVFMPLDIPELVKLVRFKDQNIVPGYYLT